MLRARGKGACWRGSREWLSLSGSSVRGDFSCERGRSLGRRVQVEG